MAGTPADIRGVVVEKATSLGAWADVIRDRFVPLQIAPHDASELAGSVHSRLIGHLQAAVVVSTPQTFTRTRRLASASGADLWALGLVEAGTGHLEQDGRACTVTGGDFALYDTSRPFTWSLAGDWKLRVYTWPREAITLTDPECRRLTATVVDGSAGVGRLLSPVLTHLAQAHAGLSAAGSARLADEVAELTITAALEAAHSAEDCQPGPEHLRRIQIFIEEHLADPALAPQRIAQEFFISTRTLHRLFARHGLTVNAWIKTRRLEACRRALVSPGSQHLSITEVASRFGFSNPAFFSRAFTAQYGASPRRYRVLHRA